ncbi:hypothetical protein [Microbacterium aurugineum]|uniref:hypothetical protein n=1 Tax=Microbacterium aurugineum TaxID=2851642 RepID=UPI0020C0D45A|nr:hypothetical protein [Microbacterium aurugineum]MCK8477228.1 hypothetical protein [Microbacterium aurugineum]
MRPHFQAFKSLLLAVSGLANKVYSNVRRTAGGEIVRENYVVLFPDGPNQLDDVRYMARQSVHSRSQWRYDVRIVAVDADGLLMIADAVMSVIGKIPAVAGRKCDPVSLVPGVEEGKGRFDPLTDLHYLDLSFEFVSRRAA